MGNPSQAYIWRKTVYESRNCPVCGTTLLSKDGTPQNVRIVDARKVDPYGGATRVFCQVCGLYVAQIVPYTPPCENIPSPVFMGEWKEKEQE